MYSNHPLVSLITVSYNSAKTIRDTIESVLNQTYNRIEYIVIDGLSSDSTLLIIDEYKEAFKFRGYNLKIISEKDCGLYDAMNKGVSNALGEIVGIINSDDFYSNQMVIQKVVDIMVEKKAHCIYGDLHFVDYQDTSKIVRIWKAKKGDFRLGWNPPHPTTFISKETYNNFGLYRVDFRISSDYDILFRFIHKGKIKVEYLQEFLIKMRSGGVSTRGIKNNIIASKEIYISLKENKQKFKILIIILRLINKLKQFIR
jgi:glycosyltransferase involved in cell wall biosynthesis